MPTDDAVQFWEWFAEERERRRLSFRAIEKLAGGKPNGKLNKRAAALLPPTLENCKLIAEVFGLPLETVLKRANLVVDETQRPELQELLANAGKLTPENLALVQAVTLALLHDQPGLAPTSSHFRVVGLPDGPDLPERPYTVAEFERFLRDLAQEERAALAQALGVGHAGGK
jgi:hypothetical protein